MGVVAVYGSGRTSKTVVRRIRHQRTVNAGGAESILVIMALDARFARMIGVHHLCRLRLVVQLGDDLGI